VQARGGRVGDAATNAKAERIIATEGRMIADSNCSDRSSGGGSEDLES